MKANEFVKKFGWDFCNEFSKKGYEIQEIYPNDIGIGFIDDLKRIVDSHEIIKDYYGLVRAKEHAESKYTAPEIAERLKQAISDVEACQ